MDVMKNEADILKEAIKTKTIEVDAIKAESETLISSLNQQVADL